VSGATFTHEAMPLHSDRSISTRYRKIGDPGWIETVRGVGFRLRAG
jgi:hypothetical protein